MEEPTGVLWSTVNILARMKPFRICAPCMKGQEPRGVTGWSLFGRWATSRCPNCGTKM